MVTITSITVERGFTINTGNFESAKFGASVTITVGEDEDPDAVYSEAVAFVEKQISADIDEFNS